MSQEKPLRQPEQQPVQRPEQRSVQQPVQRSLHNTRALCPECLKVLEATISADEDHKVWMTRCCPHHGEISTLIWPDEEHYLWLRSLAFPKIPPDSEALRPSSLPCPTGCGICQRHKRKPTLVEIELTRRCNLRCPVCFMSAESSLSDLPSDAVLNALDAIALTTGTDTGVQITGGEPTMRDDLAEIIQLVRGRGFWGVEVNTNGLVIARDETYLKELRDAGLTGVYLQFDGITGDVYQKIRGADLLATKLAAIENCRKYGVQVVLAMTIVSGINDSQIGKVIEFAGENSDVVVGVALQPAFASGRFDVTRKDPLSMGDVIFMLADQSNGLIRVDDIWPLGCSHPLCDTGTYLVRTGETYLPVTRDMTREEYLEYFNTDSPQGSVFLDMLARKGLACRGGLSIVLMNYMDAHTADLERLEECSMFVAMPDGSLIPFCTYQLTDSTAKRVFKPFNPASPQKIVDRRGD